MRVAVIELQAWVDLAISRTGLADCWGHRGLFFFFPLSFRLPGWSYLLGQRLNYECGENSQGLEHL